MVTQAMIPLPPVLLAGGGIAKRWIEKRERKAIGNI
jgi:hypothetical protein